MECEQRRGVEDGGSGRENVVNKKEAYTKSGFSLVFSWSKEEGNKLPNKELFIQQ